MTAGVTTAGRGPRSGRTAARWTAGALGTVDDQQQWYAMGDDACWCVQRKKANIYIYISKAREKIRQGRRVTCTAFCMLSDWVLVDFTFTLQLQRQFR